MKIEESLSLAAKIPLGNVDAKLASIFQNLPTIADSFSTF
jgi:hypothetical protein